ncbi:hypothetical protein I6A60_38610 [Frankia sp. AgB1.9]|uniref:hypothetical protein n=1 Tax=unclassified Frankia TaxID=2632575 RepID=UPI0019328E6E|nr:MULTISPECIES: hypothetical protein [unclassified Frankia]MBL7491173.1 hypothetical protein [Frankia sp. AgW1.1]MBL7553702.1 hypothetical protein [Frankia sp. AgB1.9]MBL7618408.1 hypothetical protein [Frankia sp. AgB1.8]
MNGTDLVVLVSYPCGDGPGGAPEAPSPVRYFPGGCPDDEPDGWPGPLDYDGPHSLTVCPACVASWLDDHLVGYPVPATTVTAPAAP